MTYYIIPLTLQIKGFQHVPLPSPSFPWKRESSGNLARIFHKLRREAMEIVDNVGLVGICPGDNVLKHIEVGQATKDPQNRLYPLPQQMSCEIFGLV